MEIEDTFLHIGLGRQRSQLYCMSDWKVHWMPVVKNKDLKIELF